MQDDKIMDQHFKPIDDVKKDLVQELKERLEKAAREDNIDALKETYNHIPTSGIPSFMFNTPSHYHAHDIDTIEFLQRGFPPDVFTSFCRANIVKYTQRADYKNGRDDILKVVDYAKRWLDWHDKTHS